MVNTAYIFAVNEKILLSLSHLKTVIAFDKEF